MKMITWPWFAMAVKQQCRGIKHIRVTAMKRKTVIRKPLEIKSSLGFKVKQNSKTKKETYKIFQLSRWGLYKSERKRENTQGVPSCVFCGFPVWLRRSPLAKKVPPVKGITQCVSQWEDLWRVWKFLLKLFAGWHRVEASFIKIKDFEEIFPGKSPGAGSSWNQESLQDYSWRYTKYRCYELGEGDKVKICLADTSFKVSSVNIIMTTATL